MAKVTINGQSYSVAEGSTILQVCRAEGINVPTFCYDPRLKPGGTCRICVVEIEGDERLRVSCAFQAKDGMVIHTNSDKVKAERKEILENLLADHNADWTNYNTAGDSKLQDYSAEFGVDAAKAKSTAPNIVVDTKFFSLDYSKCIKCNLCVKVVNNLQHCYALQFKNGKNANDGFDFDQDKCVSCGNCVSACPTKALEAKADVPYKDCELTKVESTCPFCGVGCQLEYQVKDNKIVNVMPVQGGTNNGMLCVKGKFAYHYPSHPDRLTTPLIRDSKGGQLREASWDEAYDLVAKKFTEAKEKYTIKESCGERQVYAGQTEGLGVLSSAKISNEDNYLAQKFARVVFRNNNVDICARL